MAKFTLRPKIDTDNSDAWEPYCVRSDPTKDWWEHIFGSDDDLYVSAPNTKAAGTSALIDEDDLPSVSSADGTMISLTVYARGKATGGGAFQLFCNLYPYGSPLNITGDDVYVTHSYAFDVSEHDKLKELDDLEIGGRVGSHYGSGDKYIDYVYCEVDYVPAVPTVSWQWIYKLDEGNLVALNGNGSYFTYVKEWGFEIRLKSTQEIVKIVTWKGRKNEGSGWVTQLTWPDVLYGTTYEGRAYCLTDDGKGVGAWVEFTTRVAPATIKNIKATKSAGHLNLYGEITSISGPTIVERGFEYLIQDTEPEREDTGTEVKETGGPFTEEEYNISSWDTFNDLYCAEENKIWWFRAYCKDDAETPNKYIAETWMKNVPTVITYRCSGAIGTISLGEGGTGYQKYDNINIIQEGASGGIAKVEDVYDEGSPLIEGQIISISLYSKGENYKVGDNLSVTGGNGTGAKINILSIGLEAQQVTANAEMLDKGANIVVTRRGFRIIKEYEGDLWGIGEYSSSISDWTLEGEIEEETIIDETNGSIIGYIWRGTFYRDALWPTSQTPGDFEVGIYQYILGGGISGEGFGFYLKPNDTYKIRAIAVNELGMGFGNDGYAYTYQRLEGGNQGDGDEGKIEIGEWEEDTNGIWWKADNILQEDAICKTGQIILPSDDENVSEISAEKTITVGTIPDGATVTRIGIRLGRTEGCNEIHVYEDGEWGTGESVTFYITDFEPGSTYYKMPYIVINYGDYEEEVKAIPDHRDPARLEEWLEDYPIEVFPEVEEEDEDELDQTVTDSSVGDISYRTIIREIKCEKIADQSFIDKAGRRRSQSINNHLIQSRANCKTIIDDYIDKFKIIKLKVAIDYDIPIPFEREDAILLGDGKEKYKEDGQGLIAFKTDGEGEILQQDYILAKIRKMDSRYTSGTETIINIELEV